MKIIEQEHSIWGQTPTDTQRSIEWIERAGRTCYNSLDKIKEGSAEKFVNNIWKRGHFSVLEHSNLVMRTRSKAKFPLITLQTAKSIFNSRYFHFCIHNDYIYIAGNWRAWIEFYDNSFYSEHPFTDNPFTDSPFVENKINTETISINNITSIFETPDYETVIDPNDIPIPLRRITVGFVTDRAVMAEITRHRDDCSFSVQSQRYCRYDNLEFIKPFWYDRVSEYKRKIFNDACMMSEHDYSDLLSDGLKAEEARAVLNNSVKTIIIMTANVQEWKHIFGLRTSKAAYPQIRNLINPVQEYFEEKGLV